MPTNKVEPQESPPIIISYVKDLANLCSLAGLACTILAIYFSLIGIYYAAIIGMIWAVAFDWADGLVARKMKGRTPSDQTFGMQLDALIDVVNYGVTPAILLLSYGNFEPIFLPGAFILVAASAIRLSYFNTYGLSGDAKYTGLALDNNNIALAFIFLFESVFSAGIFSVILYVSSLGLAALNVSQIKTPKLSYNPANVYRLTFYTLMITGIYSWKLL
ncbi:CDP-alcohol phosphatidyltransferase [Halieaceae bacterium IMCC14734]|uniref:CDP-alcohol phosphatidyltransferase n=1 Tax=Candidatus Litorirhabdus singularis TaxID=2518993 RepID=A0ABT3TL84_9GAMM|nr:CDP-alcohol phosphatidyltransferase family protein [Candidatus Litorirhabdus singularis]MCX2982759.1 CDP-alcohol phosphatidyltransferase [Candidatus Litorirhabdus singularis]